MLNPKMIDAINAQIAEEMYSAHLYLAMAQYFKAEKLRGFAHWLDVQAGEETSHARKLMGYLDEHFAPVVIPALAAPPKRWESPKQAIAQVLQHEQHITACIQRLADLADELRDRATANLLAWFIDEQVEEEHNATSLVDRIEQLGGFPPGLFMLDRELGQRKAG